MDKCGDCLKLGTNSSRNVGTNSVTHEIPSNDFSITNTLYDQTKLAVLVKKSESDKVLHVKILREKGPIVHRTSFDHAVPLNRHGNPHQRTDFHLRPMQEVINPS